MDFVSGRGGGRLFSAGSALIALVAVALLAFAASAQAAETIYWDNYGGPVEGDSVSFADISGSGGGELNLGAVKLESPEGMAYDPVTNRLFVGSQKGTLGELIAINLDGSGAAPFTAPGAPIDHPEGVAIDLTTRTVYWENTQGGGSIAWAKLDGSAGGVLSTAGVTLSSPCCRIALDPVGGRIYFANNGSIAYVKIDNTGGGELNLTGSTVTPGGEGFAVDDAAGRLYFLGESGKIGFANLNGTGGGDVPVGSAVVSRPWGLALDPSAGRLYWGNEGNAEDKANALGFVGTNGLGGGAISIASAPVNGPQDPVIIKSPSLSAPPQATRHAGTRALLECSQGTWAPDYPGSFVYQSPHEYRFQWTRNGKVIPKGFAFSENAKFPGTYACTVTGVNPAGAASATSNSIVVKPGRDDLRTKKKARAAPGSTATFKVKISNPGDLASKKARICVKLPKSAAGELRMPKCRSIAAIEPRRKKTLPLKIRVLPSAHGTYKVTFQVKGTSGKAAKAKLIVS